MWSDQLKYDFYEKNYVCGMSGCVGNLRMHGGGASGGQGGGSGLEVEFVNRCNYESVRLEFHPSQLQYEVVNNPSKSGLNTTRKCAKVVSVGGDNEFLWCAPMPRKL